MASQSDFSFFRQTIKDRLLIEMLRGIRGTGGDWKVLVMDEFTVKVMSSTCKMADITDEGVSLVEDLKRTRQPLPHLDGVYFVQPTKKNILQIVEDMGSAKPLYRSVFIFFSSPVMKDQLLPIKENNLLRTRIAALREMNLEISTIDRQGFVTDQDTALVELFSEENHKYERCIDTMATRVGTVFASMKEFPAVRYRAAKTSSSEAGSVARARDLVPTKLAASLWEKLLSYKTNLPGFPHKDTCDLLILDRTTDPVAPLVHDWSYAGLAFDLLDIDGNKYKLKVSTESGNDEEKIVLLDEHDSVWNDLRDLFIGEALQKVTRLSDDIVSKQVAQRGELSAKEMQALIASLGKYRDQKDKVDLHVNMAESLMKKVKNENLMRVGKLEQSFVFGGGGTFKDLFQELGSRDISVQSKLRLMAIYAATHPDKFTPEKRDIYMKTAKLEEDEMLAVIHLDKLGLSISKETQTKGTALTFGKKPTAKGGVSREDRDRSGGWELMQFYPLIHDLLEDMDKGVLDTKLFPYIQEPKSAPLPPTLSQSSSVSSTGSSGSGSGSVRSARTVGSVRSAGGSWASKRQQPQAAAAPAAAPEPSVSKELLKGRRLFVFVVGGITRSELRAIHLLTAQLKREVIIGSSSVDTPQQFLQRLSELK